MKYFPPDPLGLPRTRRSGGGSRRGGRPRCRIELADCAARVANFAKGFANGLPVHVTVTEMTHSYPSSCALKSFKWTLTMLFLVCESILRIAVKHHVPTSNHAGSTALNSLMYLDISNGLSKNLFHTSSMAIQFSILPREEAVFESAFGNGSNASRYEVCRVDTAGTSKPARSPELGVV